MIIKPATVKNYRGQTFRGMDITAGSKIFRAYCYEPGNPEAVVMWRQDGVVCGVVQHDMSQQECRMIKNIMRLKGMIA